MEGFIGSIIFEFIGVFFRWSFIAIVRKIKGQEVPGFWIIWNGRKNKTFQEHFEYGVTNIVIGVLVTFSILYIISLFW
jgi:hypothetical protein